MKNVRTIWLVPFRDKTLTGLMAVVLFLCACPASAGIIHFRDGLTHDIDYAIADYVRVDWQAPYMYTTVNWLNGGDIGSPYYLQGYGHSRINILGGSIWYLFSYDSSQVNISGGSIFWLCSYTSSQVNMSGGSIDDWLNSYTSSQVNISGGSIGGGLGSFNSSQIDISGGAIHDFLVLWDQSEIRIFGSDFAVDGQPVGYVELTSILGGYPYHEPLRHLTGTLLSGELIDNDFRIGYNARIVLVPEPATIFLLGLGAVMVGKRGTTDDRGRKTEVRGNKIAGNRRIS